MDKILYLIIKLVVAFSRIAKVLGKIGIGSYDEWEKGKKLKVLLVGYNGARNTGSDVRVITIARQVKELFGADNVQITVMTLDTDNLQGYFDEDVTLLKFSSLFPIPLYKACSSHHVAILCEGSTLKSTFANALTLFLCEAAGIMRMQNKPCIAFGSEVGRLDPFMEKAAKDLCRDAYFITRTKGSYRALQKLGLKGHSGTDAAWLYEGAIDADSADEMLRSKGWDGEKKLLGIAVINPFCWPVRPSLYKWIKGMITGNLSGQYDKWYFFSESLSREKAYKRYIRQVANAVNAFAGNGEYYPVIIGMEKLDATACKDLRKELYTESAMFLSGDYSADIMTGILRRLSMLVTSRYHASVLSLEKGCPVIAISMDERLNGILKELKLDDKYLFRTSDAEFGDRLHTSLMNADSDSLDIHEHISKALIHYKEKQREMGLFMKQFIQDRL